VIEIDAYIHKLLAEYFNNVLSCDVAFHPQMFPHALGRNSKNTDVYVYYQLCPKCKEPIVGLKETSGSPYINDDESLTLLRKIS